MRTVGARRHLPVPIGSRHGAATNRLRLGLAPGSRSVYRSFRVSSGTAQWPQPDKAVAPRTVRSNTTRTSASGVSASSEKTATIVGLSLAMP